MKRLQKKPFAFSEELFSVTLHELRTPVSSINGYSSILLTGELGALNQKQKEFVQRVQELCQFATTLIGNLLLLVKSGMHRPHTSKEFVRVNQVARDVIKSIQGEVTRKKLKLALNFPKTEALMWGDPRDVTQIFLNLISNAVKFTPNGGRIEILVSVRSRTIHVEIADTGVGISPKSLPRIFEQFYHEDHPEIGAPQGSGLGLAIVKRTVKLYRGKISVSSRQGKGTRFKIEIPIRSEQEVLQEYFQEIWSQARGSGQSIGVAFFQVKPKAKEVEPFLKVLEKVLRDLLRQEDKILRVSQNEFLAVMVKVNPKGFQSIIERLQVGIRDNPVIGKSSGNSHYQWRMVSLLAPVKQGVSASRLLQTAAQKLKQAWSKDERDMAVRSNGVQV